MNTSSNTDESAKTIGPILQEARTVKGLTVEAAAAASKVPLSYVRLMEQEQFHLVPDPLYLVRFLTDYARFLGLDPKQVEAQLKEQAESIRARELAHSVPSIDSGIDLRRLLLYGAPAVVAIPLIFIGLSLFSGSPSKMPPAQQSEMAAPQSVGPPAPEATTAIPPDSQASSAGAGQPGDMTPVRQVAAPQAQEPPGAPSRYRLRAEAKDATWISVSVDGAPWKGILMRPGEVSQWSANSRFVVTIGNIKGVVLSLNDKPIALKAKSGLVIRNLILPTAGEPSPAGQ